MSDLWPRISSCYCTNDIIERVGVSRLAQKQMHQMDLFEWADRNESEEKERRVTAERKAKLDAMMNAVNEKYGNGTLKKGSKS